MSEIESQIEPIGPAAPITESDNIQDKMFDYNSAIIYLKRLHNDWKEEIDLTEKRRLERKVEVDIESSRQKGDLDEDETICPVRVIDSNITREQPSYVNYLKNSRRIAIFEPLDDPSKDCDLLEQEFTKKCTYTAWEVPHYKCIDGSQAHGWDAIEVVYDSNKPGNFSLEQVGHDKLFFPRSAINIQACPRIVRAYDITITQLVPWVKQYGFNQEQVDLIMASRKDNQKEAETIRIYKGFYKYNGIVMVCWYSLTNGATNWLKAPENHYIGIDKHNQMGGWEPEPLTEYPTFLLPYRLNEEQKIMDARGRCFLDGYHQEAMTALWSAYVNAMNRASGIYASPATDDGTGSALKEIEGVKLTHGRVFNKPIQFWSMPYPDPQVLKTLQFAETKNANENNQVNFAAQNREDSRKTAKEIGAAQQQQVLINSVQLTLFSTYIREVYSLVWKVVQSQALQNKIQFLLIQKQIPMTNPINPQMSMIGQNGQPMMQTIWVNDTDTLSKRYTVRAAGDVDVIAKDEIINKMKSDWPVISQTVLKDAFLSDYVRLAYPERSQQYTQILQQGNQMQALQSLVARLSTILDGVLKDAPEVVNGLQQQEKADLAQTMQEAHQMAAPMMGGQPQ